MCRNNATLFQRSGACDMREIRRGCTMFCLAAIFSSVASGSVIFANTAAISGGSDPVASIADGYFGPLYASFLTGASGMLNNVEVLLSGDPASLGSIDVGLYVDASTFP